MQTINKVQEPVEYLAANINPKQQHAVDLTCYNGKHSYFDHSMHYRRQDKRLPVRDVSFPQLIVPLLSSKQTFTDIVWKWQ
jgi:hypothetical protein